jgi:hypothetical protein
VVISRFAIRVTAMLTVLTSCSAPNQSLTTTDAEAGAAYDCGTIQGPVSTNEFYEDNPTYKDPVDDSAAWTTSAPE